MVIVYVLGPLAGLIVGGVTGWLLTLSHFERIAARQQEYEEEMAEARELHAARALLRRRKLKRPPGGG
jgi:hypothetical protein